MEAKMSRNDEFVAVVTGGSRGIGKRVARALTEHGAKVYIAGRSQQAESIPLRSAHTYPARFRKQ
jgi:NAD(P)-dependent dehydrogenase (short-subunit alcohol dehydrogenase family)